MKTKKLRAICQAMKKEELLMVVNRLISSVSKHDKGLISKLVDDYENKILPTPETVFSNERTLIHSLVYARYGCVLMDYYQDIITLAKTGIEKQGGYDSREVILFLNNAHREFPPVPMSGIPSEYSKTLKIMLTVAGFECLKKYRSVTMRTDRVWRLKDGYAHLTLAELITRFEEKLKQVNPDANYSA